MTLYEYQVSFTSKVNLANTKIWKFNLIQYFESIKVKRNGHYRWCAYGQALMTVLNIQGLKGEDSCLNTIVCCVIVGFHCLRHYTWDKFRFRFLVNCLASPTPDWRNYGLIPIINDNSHLIGHLLMLQCACQWTAISYALSTHRFSVSV